jgi:hypothetical protein
VGGDWRPAVPTGWIPPERGEGAGGLREQRNKQDGRPPASPPHPPGTKPQPTQEANNKTTGHHYRQKPHLAPGRRPGPAGCASSGRARRSGTARTARVPHLGQIGPAHPVRTELIEEEGGGGGGVNQSTTAAVTAAATMTPPHRRFPICHHSCCSSRCRQPSRRFGHPLTFPVTQVPRPETVGEPSSWGGPLDRTPGKGGSGADGPRHGGDGHSKRVTVPETAVPTSPISPSERRISGLPTFTSVGHRRWGEAACFAWLWRLLFIYF